MKKSKQIIKKGKKIFIFAGVLGLVLHIILFQSINSLFILPILFYWFFLGVVYRFHEKVFFSIALFFLVLTPFAFLLNQFSLAEKFSVWEILFLLLGLTKWLLFDILFKKRKNKGGKK